MSDDLPPLPSDDGDSATEASGRLRKAPTAFRTISEVAEDLNIPQHVLRFWETKFPQLKPLKRGGGRRYYRPEDIALLRRIGDLLYTQGYTIKGVQRLLREGGLDAPDIPEPEAESAPEILPPPEPGHLALREAVAELEGVLAELRALVRAHTAA
jgi:DNA-binding transcriptional MerR regulator